MLVATQINRPILSIFETVQCPTLVHRLGRQGECRFGSCSSVSVSGLGSSSSYLPARYLVSRYPSCVICTSGSGWTTEVATFESLMIALSVFKKAVCRAAKPKLASVTERPERRKGAGLLPSARPKKRQSSDVENTPTCIVSTCPCPMAKVTGTQLRSSPNRSSSD